jgi:DNA repair exonuclease SbcCD ATPase subunit
LKWKNFLSTGNYPTTLDLTRHRNTLISGENGAGKSTMLDALTYALFGKSFRGINIPQLPNSINEKNCEVEIEFTIGKDEYRVFRSLNPKKFEIYKNGNLIPQDAKSKDYQKILEEQILKMSYKSFTQVVILGSSNYVPFMKLTAKDRRLVVENLLDIDVFSVMNVLVKARLQMTKECVRDIDHKIELVKSKVEEKQKMVKTLQRKSTESIESYKKDIEETQAKIQEINHDIDKMQRNIDGLLTQVQDKDSISKNLLKMEGLEQQLKTKIKTIEKSLKFYKENDICPSCKQDIQDHHKECVVIAKSTEQQEVETGLTELISQIERTENRQGEINSILSTIQNIEKKVSERQNEVGASNRYITKVQKQIEAVQGDSGDIQKSTDEMNQLIGKGKEYVENRKDLVEDRHYYDIASVLLKDSGIKAKIIKHYLPIMNKLINKYLADMDFFCHFDLDENFNETIKSRHRDEFTYHSFSEGERLRIDLSLLLAWREVARLKNSVNCNLLILDEVFDSSLDSVGTEEFLKLLTTFGSRANIFVISHKSDSMTDKFQNHIVFEKKNNFSRIK